MSENNKQSINKKRKHLPIYGVSPVYGGVVFALTVAAFFCRKLPAFSAGDLPDVLQYTFISIGVLLIALGVYMWIQAVIVTKLDDGIKENRLVTNGIFAWVRNPIYSAITIACTGALFIIGNWLFFFLPFLYWLLLTALMKNTEEKWLRDLYGKEYYDYCKRVNRCIPWFPKKH